MVIIESVVWSEKNKEEKMLDSKLHPEEEVNDDDTNVTEDHNVADKESCSEYHKRVEKPLEPKDPVYPETLGILMKNESSTGTGVKRIRKIATVPSRWHLIGLVIPFLVPLSEGTVLKSWGHFLPGECLSRLKDHGYDCPVHNGFDGFWVELNYICCPSSMRLHCQMDINDVNGRTFSMITCLPEHTIPPGIIGRLIKDENGTLVLDTITTCPEGTYRTGAVNSSSIRYRYCSDKTEENAEKEKVCDGGPVADDHFVCRKGYKPTSEECSTAEGFNPSTSCSCQLLECEAGQQPSRNLTITKPLPPCSQTISKGAVVYGCEPIAPTSTQPSGSTESSDSTGSPTSTLFENGKDSTTTVKQKKITTTMKLIGAYLVLSLASYSYS